MENGEAVLIDNPDPSEYGRVGELIYLVDPYIYPALFGSPENARIEMPRLMSIDNGPFARDRVLVARIDNEIAGVLVLYTEPFFQPADLSVFYNNSSTLPVSCKDVCDRYLVPMCSSVTLDEVYIPCIATDPAYRGRGVASALIRYAAETAGERELVLDVLEDNANAIRLYEKMGFQRFGIVKGYAYQGDAPSVIQMRTDRMMTQ